MHKKGGERNKVGGGHAKKKGKKKDQISALLSRPAVNRMNVSSHIWYICSQGSGSNAPTRSGKIN